MSDSHSNTRLSGRADTHPWVQPGGLGAGQLGACSLVAAELEEAPKTGPRAQVQLRGGASGSYPAPGLPLPLSPSRVDLEAKKDPGGREEFPGTGLVAAEV